MKKIICIFVIIFQSTSLFSYDIGEMKFSNKTIDFSDYNFTLSVNAKNEVQVLDFSSGDTILFSGEHYPSDTNLTYGCEYFIKNNYKILYERVLNSYRLCKFPNGSDKFIYTIDKKGDYITILLSKNPIKYINRILGNEISSKIKSSNLIDFPEPRSSQEIFFNEKVIDFSNFDLEMSEHDGSIIFMKNNPMEGLVFVGKNFDGKSIAESPCENNSSKFYETIIDARSNGLRLCKIKSKHSKYFKYVIQSKDDMVTILYNNKEKYVKFILGNKLANKLMLLPQSDQNSLTLKDKDKGSGHYPLPQKTKGTKTSKQE